LESSKEIDGNGKRSYEEIVQQKKVEFIRIEERRQHVTGG